MVVDVDETDAEEDNEDVTNIERLYTPPIGKLNTYYCYEKIARCFLELGGRDEVGGR